MRQVNDVVLDQCRRRVCGRVSACANLAVWNQVNEQAIDPRVRDWVWSEVWLEIWTIVEWRRVISELEEA